MNLIQMPVTGQEISPKDSIPIKALIDFYRAFNTRNFELMQTNWLQTEEASMSNPLGGIKRGWSEIKQVYQKIFNGPARVYVEFYDYTVHETSNMFIAVGREKGSLSFNNKIVDLHIRTSRAYLLTNNQWQQIHHHGSMDQPELLNTYQSTLLNNQPEE